MYICIYIYIIVRERDFPSRRPLQPTPRPLGAARADAGRPGGARERERNGETEGESEREREGERERERQREGDRDRGRERGRAPAGARAGGAAAGGLLEGAEGPISLGWSEANA